MKRIIVCASGLILLLSAGLLSQMEGKAKMRGIVYDEETGQPRGFNSGNVAEAAKYFRKSVDIDREFGDGYFQLGMASVALNKPEEAVETLKKFLQLAPDSAQAATAKSVIEALTKK